MEIGIVSLNVVKKISALFIFMVFGVVNAMDRDTVLYTSRKESKFDFLNMQALVTWHNSLSDEKRHAIIKNVEKKENKKYRVLFYFITRCNADIQTTVACHIFDGKEGAANKFCNMPLCNALNCYGWSKKVFRTKDRFNLPPFCDPAFERDIIFTFAKEIITFFDWFGNRKTILSKNELESIDRLSRIFLTLHIHDKSDREMRFKIHDSLTMNNFIKQFSKEQFYILPILVAPFVSKLISQNDLLDGMYKYADQEKIDSGKINGVLNAALYEQYEKTGDLSFLSRIKPVENPVSTGYERFFGMKIAIHTISSLFLNKLLLFFDDKLFSLLLGGLCSCALSQMVNNASIVPRQWAERPWLGIGCVTGLYVLVCSVYNIIKMRTSRNETMKWNELSALLKRTDIIIE